MWMHLVNGMGSTPSYYLPYGSLFPCPVSSGLSLFSLSWGVMGGGGTCCCGEGEGEGEVGRCALSPPSL